MFLLCSWLVYPLQKYQSFLYRRNFIGPLNVSLPTAEALATLSPDIRELTSGYLYAICALRET